MAGRQETRGLRNDNPDLSSGKGGRSSVRPFLS